MHSNLHADLREHAVEEIYMHSHKWMQASVNVSLKISYLQAPGASAPAAGGGNATAAVSAGSSGSARDELDVMADVCFDGGFKVPGDIYNRLFDYQKTGAAKLAFAQWASYPHIEGVFVSSSSLLKY